MKTSFTEIVRRAQGIGLLVEQGTTNHPAFAPQYAFNPTMMFQPPNAAPQDDPYDINDPTACRQATNSYKLCTDKALKPGTVCVGDLIVWIRSFGTFCKTLTVRNPVRLAILHLQPPVDAWAELYRFNDGSLRLDAKWTQFTEALLSAPFTNSADYFYTTTQKFYEMKQANLKVSEYIKQANEIFLGRETHPFVQVLHGSPPTDMFEHPALARRPDGHGIHFAHEQSTTGRNACRAHRHPAAESGLPNGPFRPSQLVQQDSNCNPPTPTCRRTTGK